MRAGKQEKKRRNNKDGDGKKNKQKKTQTATVCPSLLTDSSLPLSTVTHFNESPVLQLLGVGVGGGGGGGVVVVVVKNKPHSVTTSPGSVESIL